MVCNVYIDEHPWSNKYLQREETHCPRVRTEKTDQDPKNVAHEDNTKI